VSGATARVPRPAPHTELDAAPGGGENGLPYASTATGVNPPGRRSRHARWGTTCTWPAGRARRHAGADKGPLARTVLMIAQPAEETVQDAREPMIRGRALRALPQARFRVAVHDSSDPAGRQGVLRPGLRWRASIPSTSPIFGRGGHAPSRKRRRPGRDRRPDRPRLPDADSPGRRIRSSPRS